MSNPLDLPEGRNLRTDPRDLVGERFLSGFHHRTQLVREAWVPWITVTRAWSSINAVNLAAMSGLAYAEKRNVRDVFLKLRGREDPPTNFFKFRGRPVLRRVPRSKRFKANDEEGKEAATFLFGDDPAGTGTEFFAVASAEQVLVSVRGTELTTWTDRANWDLRDVGTDVDFHRVLFEEGLRHVEVHRGFYRGFRFVRERLDPYLNQLVEDPVTGAKRPLIMTAEGGYKDFVLCGHSLGGAVATLVAAYLRRHYPGAGVMCYTYGAPRVGNERFARHFSGAGEGFLHYRHVLHNDPVPALPPFDLMPGMGWSYTHHGRMVYLAHAAGGGEDAPLATITPTDGEKDAWARNVHSGEHAVPPSDHYLKSYYTVLKERLRRSVRAYTNLRDGEQMDEADLLRASDVSALEGIEEHKEQQRILEPHATSGDNP